MAVKYSFVARGHDILATKILEGKYKEELKEQYGAEQVKQWRQSYDKPPPAIDFND